jgi:hypothetical protein
VCGEALPWGPRAATLKASACHKAGLLQARTLHLDHTPPLEDHERQSRSAVEDMGRIGLLCRSCHARKTQEENR